MKAFFAILIILVFAILQVLIGGTRVLFALPGIELIALAAVFSAWPWLKSSKKAGPICLLSVLIFIGYVLVRNRLSPIDYIARLQFFIAAGCGLLYLLTAVIIDHPGDRKRIFYGLIFLAFVQVIVGAVQFKEGNQWMPIAGLQRRDDWWRASGLFISPNHFAGFLELTALMAFSFVIWGRVGAVGKILIGYVGLTCVAGVAISGSRGGYLSLATGLVVLLVLCLLVLGRVRPEKLLPIGISALIVMAAGFAIVVSVMFTSSFVRSRLENINDRENVRFLLWDSALQQYKLSPVIGTGGFTFLYYGRLYRDPGVQSDPIHVHNDYLQLLADYGIIGAALFFLVYIIHLVSGLRGLSWLATRTAESGEIQSDELALCVGALCGLAAYTVHSVVDFNMQIPSNALVMAVIFGILASSVQRTEEVSWFQKATGWLGRIILLGGGVALLIYGIPLLPGEWFAERARVALKDYKLQDSLRLAEEGIRWEKNNPDLYYYAAEASREMAAEKMEDPAKHSQQAIDYFQKGLEVFPYDSRLAFKLAHAWSDRGDYAEASFALDRAEELDPNSSYLLAYRGLVDQKAEYYDQARDFYRRALQLDGKNQIAEDGLKAVEKILSSVKPLPPTIELPTDLQKVLEDEQERNRQEYKGFNPGSSQQPGSPAPQTP